MGTVSGLVAGSAYLFTVVAYDAAGTESAPTEEIVYVIPAAPTSLDATFVPPGSAFQPFVSPEMSLASGTYAITIEGVSNGPDCSAFVDSVALNGALVNGGGFEHPALPHSYAYTPSGTSWTFTGLTGVQANGSAWAATPAPEGDQTAVIQSVNNESSAVSKVVTLPAGNYVLSFLAAQRATFNSSPQTLRVSLQPSAGPTPTPTPTATPTPTPSPTATPAPTAGNRATFRPVSPARVWDSRSGPGPAGKIGPGQGRNVIVLGVGGVPATGVSAVALNVTAVRPTAATYVTVWPAGEARPVASNLNVPAGDVRPNLVIVNVGAEGAVSFFNYDGDVDVVADVAGWFGPGDGDQYTGLSPARVWDSRYAPGPTGQIGPGQTRNVTITGMGGVPAAGVSAVVLNVTAVNPSAATYVTVWPTGESQPLASNLNVPAGDVRPNLVVVKVGVGGGVSFFNYDGNVDIVADVAGWFGRAGEQQFTGVSPARVWDSRSAPGPHGQTGQGQVRDVTVTGFAGVPARGVSAVVLNVTAVNPSAATYLTVWPTGEPMPVASNLNVPAGDVRPNSVIAKVGAGGRVSFFNYDGNVDVVADIAGWFGTSAEGGALQYDERESSSAAPVATLSQH